MLAPPGMTPASTEIATDFASDVTVVRLTPDLTRRRPESLLIASPTPAVGLKELLGPWLVTRGAKAAKRQHYGVTEE